MIQEISCFTYFHVPSWRQDDGIAHGIGVRRNPEQLERFQHATIKWSSGSTFLKHKRDGLYIVSQLNQSSLMQHPPCYCLWIAGNLDDDRMTA